ncbi:MAG: type IV pilus twitching motility protein PilT [Planctomycetota bacterium]
MTEPTPPRPDHPPHQPRPTGPHGRRIPPHPKRPPLPAPAEVSMEALLRHVHEAGSSDLILSAHAPPHLRIDGELRPVHGPPLEAEQVRSLIYSVLYDEQVKELEQERELDFSISYHGLRFRGNAFWQRGSLAVAFRPIPARIPAPRELGLPDHIETLVDYPQGLVLVTGATGQGKSTTLASLLDRVNRLHSRHVITIEDPIEFVHPNKRCVVEQREVGSDTKSFANALRRVLRQNPDVILVGELRDRETVQTALTAAETGHLVLSTLHTNDAVQAIDRLVDVFPDSQHRQVRSQLSLVLLAVLSQRLVRGKQGGRVLALEVLINNQAVSNQIREGKLALLYGTMEVGGQEGMQTMNQALEALLGANQIDAREVQRYKSQRESGR